MAIRLHTYYKARKMMRKSLHPTCHASSQLSKSNIENILEVLGMFPLGPTTHITVTRLTLRHFQCGSQGGLGGAYFLLIEESREI